MIYSTSNPGRSSWAAWTAHPAAWFGLAAIFLTLDFGLGPNIQFPITFIFPVALAAWHRGLPWALFFAVGQPAVRFAFNSFRDAPWSMTVSVVNLLIRVAVLCGFAWLVAHTVWQRRRIGALEGLLPVCAWCKRIRDEQDVWQPLDGYLSQCAELNVTHSICPDCRREHFSGTAKA